MDLGDEVSSVSDEGGCVIFIFAHLLDYLLPLFSHASSVDRSRVRFPASPQVLRCEDKIGVILIVRGFPCHL